jgi:hypothetical protein
MFLTPNNITIPIWNSLNMKLHFHLTALSSKTTNQSLIMTSTSLNNNTNAFSSAPLCVRYSILTTTPVPIFSLQFANLQKPVSALAEQTFMLLSGSLATYNNAHTMPSNSTQKPIQFPSTTYAANTAYHTPT